MSQSSIEPLPAEQYEQEIFRTKPDLVVYRPGGEFQNDAENQQVIVMPTASGDFLATWTQATHENHPDQRIVVARSADRGRTWSAPVMIDGATPEQQAGAERGKYQASWSFFVKAPALKRIYLFYNKNIGRTDSSDDVTGILRFRLSEDEGKTWSQPFDHLALGRGAIDHPDPTMPVNYVACFQSFLNARGVPMASFTRWSSRHSDGAHLLESDSEIWFLRFDNILSEADPQKLQMTTLPDSTPGVLGHGLQVPSPLTMGRSVAQEAMTVNLPDGRLLTCLRTLQGCNYWSASADDGETWSSPLPLRYSDVGPRVLNPISPSPLYEYAPGKYFLIFHNNDGFAFGVTGPLDNWNRRPTYLLCGEFSDRTTPPRAGAPAFPSQPLVFGEPKLLMDADGVALGPSRRVEPTSYPSYFHYEGNHYLWYPDRKHFVLGRLLNDFLD